ncbi:vitamin D3 hydroxylase-associated protein-like [Branchiostoma floridae]|uniref:Vitamin D3 hydroxylase-associated protein-like n=1 Tax=Branchiostoma floridae TaxID=7739 RepID=A0A9J7N4Q6_BRAFL|nr:vitamin D3 hydroxylase-associated protein-like [Branchiostoma floridae]
MQIETMVETRTVFVSGPLIHNLNTYNNNMRFDLCERVNSVAQGMVTTLGVTKYLETPAGEDAVIVQVLKKQGAVPFVRTNIPQSLLSYSCSNPVFGNTVNPLDPERTSGGSSGGEAALIKAGGSVLGLGSDGLGSVRIPAHFCGICALKPTGLRISDRGLLKGTPGIQGVIAAPGLLARDVDSLALGLKALLVPDMFQLDPRVAPIPFQQEVGLITIQINL